MYLTDRAHCDLSQASVVPDSAKRFSKLNPAFVLLAVGGEIRLINQCLTQQCDVVHWVEMKPCGRFSSCYFGFPFCDAKKAMILYDKPQNMLYFLISVRTYTSTTMSSTTTTAGRDATPIFSLRILCNFDFFCLDFVFHVIVFHNANSCPLSYF
jgi:hypothetical protein